MSGIRRLAFALTLLLVAMSAFGQDADRRGTLQRGFSLVELGMSIEVTKAVLLEDPSFRYRGEPDVQFLPTTDIPIIETEGRAFVDRGIFQFHEGSLSIISVVLDRARLDYFAVYESLVDQYGEPDRLDPGQAVWESGATRISLERPLTVKYIDSDVLRSIIEAGEIEEALDQVTRDRFLEQL